MKSETTAIFRTAAAQRYLESQEKTVLPRLVAPPVFIGLWLLLGLLVAGAAVSWWAPVPVYVACPAVVVDWRNRFPAVAGDTAVVAFVPLESRARVKRGQKLFVQFEAADERLSQTVGFVDPQIISPDAAHQQFKLNASAVSVISRPSAIAVAPLPAPPGGAASPAYVGSVYQVEIEVGSRRLISLLPLIGDWFPEEHL
jgi:hypothetical protein